jgi:hypothetical protein
MLSRFQQGGLGLDIRDWDMIRDWGMIRDWDMILLCMHSIKLL